MFVALLDTFLRRGAEKATWSLPNAYLEFAAPVYSWMRKSELLGEFLIDISYMERQPEINAPMRAMLIDWLIEVHLRFKLTPETLFITVNTIDRFLMRCRVGRQRLQLLGVTALLVSCKYQEIYPPSLSDLVHMTDRAYTHADVLAMETTVLKELQYDFTYPTPFAFAETYMQALGATDAVTEQYTRFLLDASLLELSMQRYSPSTLALAALLVCARKIAKI